MLFSALEYSGMSLRPDGFTRRRVMLQKTASVFAIALGRLSAFGIATARSLKYISRHAFGPPNDFPKFPRAPTPPPRDAYLTRVRRRRRRWRGVYSFAEFGAVSCRLTAAELRNGSKRTPNEDCVCALSSVPLTVSNHLSPYGSAVFLPPAATQFDDPFSPVPAR